MEFGCLTNCSMNVFEHQFYNFNVYKHGVCSFLHQISDKIILLKHCKTFLSVCPYDNKAEILKCVRLNENDSEKRYIFKNRGGVIIKGNRPFYSEAVTRKDVSTFCCPGRWYALLRDIQKVFQWHKCVWRSIYLWAVSQWFAWHKPYELARSPRRCKRNYAWSKQFYNCEKTSTCTRISAECIKYPCVVYEFDESSFDKKFLLMPCSSVAEFYWTISM